MTIRTNYNHTLLASYTGYITQSIVNTFVPLLFLTFQSTYQIPIDKITLLVTINFVIQLLVDLLSTKFVDRIGYRVCIVAAHLFAASGLVGISLFPDWFSDPFIGLLTAVCLYAVGGGLIEVLISPIVEACPTERKAAAMSLLHSFYCWGCVLVVLLSTLYFSLAGIQNWRILSMLWAIIPLWNAFYFTQVPISTLEETHKTIPLRSLLSKRIFWILALLMICAGASELAMSQWASFCRKWIASIQNTRRPGGSLYVCRFNGTIACALCKMERADQPAARNVVMRFSLYRRISDCCACSDSICCTFRMRALRLFCGYPLARYFQLSCGQMPRRRHRHVRFARFIWRCWLFHRTDACWFYIWLCIQWAENRVACRTSFPFTFIVRNRPDEAVQRRINPHLSHIIKFIKE